MIKVLEHGIMKITCPTCKAKLQYEQEDIQKDDKYPFIICPDCDNKVYLGPRPKILDNLSDNLDL